MSRHWTSEIDKEAEEYFASLDTDDLNKRLALAREQAKIAYRRKQTDALEDLQAAEAAIVRELLGRD